MDQAENDTPLQIENLTKIFDVPGGQEVAVSDFSIDIKEEEFITIVGPSGCGKTTTLRCIAGLETPTSGSIRANGEDIVDIPPNKRNIAMMFQNIALYPHMTVKKNIAYPLLVSKTDKDPDEAVQRAAEIMQIEDLLDKYPGDISGGQQQRTALARTVVQDPELFLMDEPLSDLDAKLKAIIRKEIQKIQRVVGKPAIYVTHDQQEAMTMSDRIIVMNDGHIEQIGTPDELFERPNNRFVAGFIGNPSINFLDTRTSVNGDLVTFEEFDETIDVSEYPDIYAEDATDSLDRAVTVGVRPQNIEFTKNEADGLIHSEVFLIERIDDRLLVTVDSEYGEIQGYSPPDIDLREGDSVYLTFDWADVHLFESESETAPQQAVEA